jgi:hypothetical protein
MAYKVKSVLSVHALVVFKCHVFAYFFADHLLIFKNSSSNPLQRACCGIQKPACYYFTVVQLAPEPG